MTASRLFTHQHPLDIFDAFKTGKFTPDILDYLNRENIANVVAKLPEHTNFITLSPDILALDSAKLCSMFHALRKHIKVVNFQFSQLTLEEVEKFSYLMMHSAYAQHAKIFNLEWDFQRFPMNVLLKSVLPRVIPSQLNHFNLQGENVEKISIDELERFMKTRLGKNTEVHLDVPNQVAVANKY